MEHLFKIEIVGIVRSTERFKAADLGEAYDKAREWGNNHLLDDGELTSVSLAAWIPEGS